MMDNYFVKSIYCVDMSNEVKREDLDLKTKSDYLNALNKTLSILNYLDDEDRFLVLGFGSKLPPCYNYVSKCFALNQDFLNPYFNSIDQTKEAYINLLEN